jgi:hypothetical protein
VAADWPRLCKAGDLRVSGSNVEVRTAERGHLVSLEERDDSLVLTSIVVPRHIVDGVRDLILLAWKRNRATQLVGFRIDRRGRLVGEASVPKAGLTAEELQLYIRTVAAECDRFEYLLTGRDDI